MKLGEEKWLVVVLIIVALVTRTLILDWGMPYEENLAHEHGLFYDSRAVVRDQYLVMRSLAVGPLGAVTTATDSYMPLGQRYLAAVPLAVWFSLTDGTSPEEILRLPFAIHARKAIVVNRVISLLASVTLVWLMYVLLRRFKVPEWLVMLVVGLLVINPVAIGLSIHGKTITLLTLVLAMQFYWLCKWAESMESKPNKSFRWLWLVALAIGLAAAAREQGPYFAGFMLVVAMVVQLKDRWKSYFSWGRLRWLVLAPIFGLALTSPDFLVKWWFWVGLVAEPHRSWDFTPVGVLADMWYLFEILFAGSIGAVLVLVAWFWQLVKFLKIDRRLQILVIWLPSFVVLLLIYPQKAPRFAEPVMFFGLLLIGVMISDLWKEKRWQRMIGVVLILLLGQSLIWGVSAWVFFNGGDNRLQAADEFHAIVPEGTAVATFFRPRHTRQIPIDDMRYEHFIFNVEASDENGMVFIPSGDLDERTQELPDYLLLQYEIDAVWYTPEQIEIQRWRSLVRSSGKYRLVKTYEKRSWHGGLLGVFGTKSRWAYLNPSVEVYKRN